MMQQFGTRLLTAVRGTGVFNGYDTTARVTQFGLSRQAERWVDPRDRYAVLWSYYKQNGLYDALQQALYRSGYWTPAMRALRNPAFRIAEFYPAHLWPGDIPAALPIQTENAAIVDPIQQVWAWSNWAHQKQVFARWLAVQGDVFLKVATRQDAGGAVNRVYFELIDPAHVCEFDTDERGYLTWIRIDVPQTKRVGDKLVRYTHVEIWDKAAGTYRRWEVDLMRGQYTATGELGTPDEERPLAAMGIDFLPIVHAKFIDVGETRGIGAYFLQLDKIDAVNADATRLAQMLFRHNKPTMVVHGAGKDATGRPLPSPRLDTRTDGAVNGRANGTAPESDSDIWYLPGTAQVDALVPALQYEAHRLVNSDGLLDLQQDCPEMAYWRITEQSMGADVTGRALRFMLGPAIKRLLEVRGNAEDALARADAMALTIGQKAGLFTGLGEYDKGALEHTFEPRSVIEESDYELAQADQARADALVKKLASGAFSVAGALRSTYDLTDDEIKAMQKERASQDVMVDGVGQ